MVATPSVSFSTRNVRGSDKPRPRARPRLSDLRKGSDSRARPWDARLSCVDDEFEAREPDSGVRQRRSRRRASDAMFIVIFTGQSGISPYRARSPRIRACRGRCSPCRPSAHDRCKGSPSFSFAVASPQAQRPRGCPSIACAMIGRRGRSRPPRLVTWRRRVSSTGFPVGVGTCSVNDAVRPP